MATRWRRRDGHLKPGKGHFLSGNNHNEQLVLNADVKMDTHSAMDHSILAIFEDSSVLSDKAGAEEDSDQLLSALTEMLESVEDDDDTLSPFSTLPETSLLMPQDTTKKNSSSDACDDLKMSHFNDRKQTEASFRPDTNTDSDVEVFTTASLVNLVRIMHSYCLRLQVEDEPGTSTKNSVLFSKEEVWKYERPTEDTDEEINVVSDNEDTVEMETKAQDYCSKPLKSALLNGSPSKKEKKKVSFGTVQVTSFDTDSQTRDIDQQPDDATLGPAFVSENDQTTDTQLQKPEGKRKPLSLQQYRKLRQNRQPLVEKHGNYTTKWPSVTVAPKELTPILGVHGQMPSSCKPAATQHLKDSFSSSTVQSMKTKASSDLPHKAKRHRPNSTAPLPELPLPVCKKSPAKKPTVQSSDPPNPVLLPLPVQRPTLNEHALDQNDDTPQEECATKSDTASKCKNQSLVPTGEQKQTPNTLDLTEQRAVSSVYGPPSRPYEPPTPVSTPVKEMTPEAAFCTPLPSPPPPLPSGIEASDLTSLLEQFEETQAKEEGESARAPQGNSRLSEKFDRAAPNSILRTNSVSPHDGGLPMPPTEELLITAAPKQLADGPDLKIPEPHGTEVILSSTREQAVRRKVLAKAIQIIDPRPLPVRRTQMSAQESASTPAHVYAAICSDHDYCAVTDHNQTSKSTAPEVVEHHQTDPSAPASCPKQAGHIDRPKSFTDRSAPQEERTKPTVNATSLTDGANRQSSSDIHLEAFVTPPTPPPSPPCRGGDGTSPSRRGRGDGRRRYRRRSRSSDSSSCSSSASSSSSRSGSRSPIRQRRRRHSSESSSCSSSSSCSGSPSPRRRRQERRPRLSRSRSSSWSRSRSLSQSPSPPQQAVSRRRTDACSRESRKLRREQEIRIQKLRAIDERRVVYVGRIRRSMTHEELRERFSQFGEVESVSLHFRDRGDHYGFVTFYNMDDAFAAIDNGGKLRRHDELPFDICFGGRRQFCNSHYADLDANGDADSSPVRSRYGEVDFDLLLKQAQKGLKR